MRRAVLCALAALALTAVAGCDPDRPVAQPPSPTARPAITDERAADLLVAATIEDDNLVILGGQGQPRKRETDLLQPDGVCGFIPGPRAVVAGHGTSWGLGADVATQSVVVYQHPDAPMAMSDLRSDSARCPQTRSQVSGVFDSHTEIALPKYPGVADAFGYCDRFTFTTNRTVVYICHALLAHGNGYVMTDVSYQTEPLQRAKNLVDRLASLAAQRLDKLPAS